MNIIPGILVKTLKELREELHKLSWAKKVHIDIMDGKFVHNKTITIHALKKAFPKADVQIHLMAHKPHRYIKPFARLGAKEFIFHAESTKHAADTLEMIRETDMKAGIAFNPETRVEKDPVIHADIALVMTVHPGFAGQPLLKTPLHKINEIKKINPLIKVGVDGGVHTNTCKFVTKAGADFAIATTEISHAEEPKQAYLRLMHRCRGTK